MVDVLNWFLHHWFITIILLIIFSAFARKIVNFVLFFVFTVGVIIAIAVVGIIDSLKRR